MSRGPGRWQRAILELLEAEGPFVLTHPDHTTAEQSAIRRAAAQLEKSGRIKLVSEYVPGPGSRPGGRGAGRLTVHPVDSAAQSRVVDGLDGKTYRQPDMDEATFRALTGTADEPTFEAALAAARAAGDLSRGRIAAELAKAEREAIGRTPRRTP